MPRYCKAIDCTKNPFFGLPNDKQATYCKKHASEGMIDIKHKQCLDPNCPTRPNFGFPDDKRATYCKSHALEDMIDIVNKRCLDPDCNNQPKFGLPNDKRATYCKKHASDDMIDIKSKQCLESNCTKQPSYGLSNDKQATYCKKHALDDMIDIISKRCLDSNCSKYPNFGYLDDKKATYCKSHALEGMIDVVSKRCLDPECDKRPNFGLPNDKRATYCKSHALDGMVDIVNKLCETCNSTQMNPKYKPNCARCYFFKHPDDPRIRNYKTKEDAYMYALLEKFPQFKLDKTIDGGCSKRRPDGFLDLLTHIIIIEIDENEHKSYDDTCNNRRTMELSQDVDHRPIVFIRLNPDGYTLNDKRMKGSFSLTKATGELKVVKKEFNKRLNSLIESVETYTIAKPEKTISVEYLYFTE